MNRQQSYILHSAIRYFAILILALLAPTFIFVEHPLAFQLITFTVLFGLERYLVWKNIKLGFIAFENSLDFLRHMLPANASRDIHFDFDFYNPKSAQSTAKTIQEAFETIITDQKNIMTRYENMNHDLTHYVRAQKILLSIAHDIILIDDTDEIYDLFLNRAIELIEGAEKGSLLLLEKDKTLRFVASCGFDLEALKEINLNAQESFLSLNRTELRKEPYIINNMYQHNSHNLDEATTLALENITGKNLESTLTAPILVDGEIFGMINLDAFKKNAFKPADITTMLFYTSQLSFVIKNRQLLDKTRYLSQYDKLTAIYNRSHFEACFENYQNHVFKGKGDFLLLLMDLNYLKKINDNFGHNAGDKALRTFVKEVQSDLPEDTLLARYGGDEFIAIIPDIGFDEGHALLTQSVERFRNVYMAYNGVQIPIRYSFGIASSPDESMMLDILVKIADHRMYTHKAEIKKLESGLFESIAQNGFYSN